jgi:hypothetical protein
MREEEFEKNLEKLKSKSPGHDMIVVIRERGYDRLSVEYLKIALAEPAEAADISVDRLYKQKDTLYSRRAQLSNKFHDYETDRERREISIAIGSIQTEIIANRQAIEQYVNTGKLPKSTAKLTLPFDGRRKEKKLHSVRSSISRYRGLLRKETDPIKIKMYEANLIELEASKIELST